MKKKNIKNIMLWIVLPTAIWLVIGITLLMVFGCSTPKAIIKESHDTLIVNKTIHDSVYFHRVDTAKESFKVGVETFRFDSVLNAIIGHRTDTIIKDKKVYIDRWHDRKELMDTTKSKALTDTIYKDKKVPQYITVYKMRWWQTVLCWLGGIVLLAILGRTAWKKRSTIAKWTRKIIFRF